MEPIDPNQPGPSSAASAEPLEVNPITGRGFGEPINGDDDEGDWEYDETEDSDGGSDMTVSEVFHECGDEANFMSDDPAFIPDAPNVPAANLSASSADRESR